MYDILGTAYNIIIYFCLPCTMPCMSRDVQLLLVMCVCVCVTVHEKEEHVYINKIRYG